jgi:hypothetical protein
MRAALVLLALAACADPRTYAPFDADALDAARAEQALQGSLADSAGAATLETAATVFPEVITAYASGLQATVAERTDAHLDTEGWGLEDAGTVLDREWVAAAESGRDAEDSHDVARAVELVDKILHVSFYQGIYGGLAERTRAGLDRAYGYVGLAEDGTPATGLAKVAAGREDEFDVAILDGLSGGFLDARDALAAGTSGDEALGDDAAFDAAVEAIDHALIRTLGLYAAHELAEVRTEAEEADVKLAEARTVWEAAAPFAAATDADTADAILAGLYPDGAPDRSTAGYLLVGLDAVQDGTTVVDPAEATAAIRSVLPE